MKRFKYLFASLLAVAFVGCTETPEATVGEPERGEDCAGLYFPEQQSTFKFANDDETSQIQITVARDNGDDAASYELVVSGDEAITFSELSFEVGDTETTIIASFPEIEDGVVYNAVVSAKSEDAYIYSTEPSFFKLSVMRDFPWVPMVGPNGEEQGVFVDEVLSMYGLPVCEVPVTVYVAEGKEGIFRLENVYSNDNYFIPMFGGTMADIGGYAALAGEEKDVYTIINASNPTMVYIEQFASGMIVSPDDGEIAIGSICEENGFSQSTYGTYDEASGIISFPAKGIFAWLTGVGDDAIYYGNGTGVMGLRLPGAVVPEGPDEPEEPDEPNTGNDYDSYTWNKCVGEDGADKAFYSDALFEGYGLAAVDKFAIEIYEAEEIPGLYRLENIYSDEYFKHGFGKSLSELGGAQAAGSDSANPNYTYIHAEDPSSVWMDLCATGVVVFAEDGEIAIGSICEDLGFDQSAYGTLEDGTISFPAQSIFMILGGNTEEIYFANENSPVTITLPGNSTIAGDAGSVKEGYYSVSIDAYDENGDEDPYDCLFRMENSAADGIMMYDLFAFEGLGYYCELDAAAKTLSIDKMKSQGGFGFLTAFAYYDDAKTMAFLFMGSDSMDEDGTAEAAWVIDLEQEGEAYVPTAFASAAYLGVANLETNMIEGIVEAIAAGAPIEYLGDEAPAEVASKSLGFFDASNTISLKARQGFKRHDMVKAPVARTTNDGSIKFSGVKANVARF